MRAHLSGARELGLVPRSPASRGRALLGLSFLAAVAALAAWRQDLVLLAAALLAAVITTWMLAAASARIEQAEKHIRILFDGSPIPAAITRACDGTFLDVNQAFLEMTGYGRDEVLGKNSVQLGFWRSPQRRAEGIRDLRETGTLHQREAPFRKKSGELAHALFSLQLISVRDQQCLLLLIQDITLRKRAEQAVRANEAFLSALVNNTDDLVLAVDRDLRVTMMNQALRAAVRRNYGFELALGEDVRRLVVVERRAELEGVFSRALRGERQRVESSFRMPNGRQVWQDESYNPILDADNRVTGVSIFVHDLGPERRAAQTIQSIVKGTAAALGEAFFRALVCELAAAVATRYALVGELIDGDPQRIRTVAACGDGAILENFEYDLGPMPCAEVIRKGAQFYASGVAEAFGDYPMVRELGIQSYLGVPLHGAAGATLGLLAVLDDKPMRDSELARTLLGVFAARAGAELDRMRLEGEKRRILAILEESPDPVGSADPAGSIQYMNAALRRVWGLERDQPIAGMRVGQHHPPWARRLMWEVGIPAAIRDGVWVGETAVMDANGREKPMSQLIIAHRAPSGEVQYLSTIMRDLSEQKRTEAVLRERERNLRLAQQVGKVGSWERDLSGDRLIWSDETYRILGVDPASFTPTVESLYQLVHPDDLPLLKAASERAQAGHGPFVVDYRAMLPDGQIRHLHARAEVLFTSDGRAQRMVGTVQDITERSQAEEALKASEARFRRLVETTQVVPWTSDPAQQRFTYIGPQIEKIAGYPAEAWRTPGFWRSKLDPEMRDEILEGCDGLREGSLEYQFLAADGRWLWLRQMIGVVVGADGRRTLQGFLLDITTEKQAEGDLRLAAKVFQASGEAIVITDAQHRIVNVNPAFTHITGYPAEEAIGRTPYTLSPSVRSVEREREMWAHISRYGVWQGEVWDRRRNGELFPRWLTASVVRDAQGRATNYIEIFSDITERKEREERVRHLAHHDALTGLPNRVLLNDRIAQAVSLAERNGTQVALMFLDLDRFKTVNDSLGHSVGDKLLQEVSARLKACMRTSDTVSRLGGDEFVILMPDVTDASAVAVAAEKVLDVVSRPYTIDGHELGSTPSIGISVFPTDGADVDTLLRNADAAMYHAKETGRNNYQFFKQDMNARALERLSLDRSLRRALERDEFRLHYQPQYDIISGRIVGMEALIRWEHPDEGLVSPARFIRFAEESGLILPIGEWVLQHACRQNRAWQDAGLPRLRVSVNISPFQFRQPNFVETVERALAAAQLEARYLELEVTEGVIMYDAERVTASLGRLKAMGVELAIDDFGTGYSSLSYLKRFPIDRLKIDQSFVRDLTTDSEDAAIVSAIIGLTRNLGLRTIAEGVETAEQLNFLRAQGCDEVQGYLLSRPLVPADCERLLAQEGSTRQMA